MLKERGRQHNSKTHGKEREVIRVDEQMLPHRQGSVYGVIATQSDDGDWSISREDTDTTGSHATAQAVDTSTVADSSQKSIASVLYQQRTVGEHSPPRQFIQMQAAKIVRLENKLDRLTTDYEDLRLMYDGLSTEHARMEMQCEEMATERDIREAKYNELLSERFNRQAAGLWVSPAKIKSAFSDLGHHVAAWCDDAVYQTARHRPEDASSARLTNLPGIPGELVPISMSSSSLAAFVMANLFQGIVHRVFSNAGTVPQNETDLWATSIDADWLAYLSERLQDQGISSNDIRLWLCLTTTALAPNRARTTRRTKIVVDVLWANVLPLLTLDSREAQSQLREKLETEIMPRAVEISRLMRKCQQVIEVRWPTNQGGFILELGDDGVERRHILTAPCLVSRELKAGEVKETILIDCRRHTIVDIGKTSGFVFQEDVT